MLKHSLALGAAAIALSAPLVLAEEGPTLVVGDAAPALSSVNWLQGGPISEWESGKVYVLDFWATWCGPCVKAIPHMNEIAKQYKDQGVTVVGVAIWPNGRMTPTAEFVTKQGDAMAYPIAEDIDGKTAEAFMAAAGQGGIPTVMIVDGQGKLAWIGHPMGGMDDVLPQVVKGDFDAKKFAEEQRVREEKVGGLMGELQRGFETSDWALVRTSSENLIAFDADEFGTLGGVYKYLALVKEGKAEEAAAWGNQLTTTTLAKSPEGLNMFAWMLVQPEGPLSGTEVDTKLAVRAAEAAVVLDGGKDANSLDTLARAYFVDGNFAMAAETQQKAVDFADNPAMKQAFEESLAAYKEKAAGQG
jgi:thiol-disulfide isomerase/thioredoxin